MKQVLLYVAIMTMCGSVAIKPHKCKCESLITVTFYKKGKVMHKEDRDWVSTATDNPLVQKCWRHKKPLTFLADSTTYQIKNK